MYPDFALKLFSYLKKKIWNQLRNRVDISAKFKWSFLVLMVKTAINICKLSDHTLKMESFLSKPFASYSVNASSNNDNLIKLKTVQKSSDSVSSPQKKSNIYSGIRELSEFVMTKTKYQSEEKETLTTPNKGNLTPQEALKFRFTKYEKHTPKKINVGNLTPQEALKFRFTINDKNNKNELVSEVKEINESMIVSKEDKKEDK